MNNENVVNTLALNIKQLERQLTDPSLTKEQKEELQSQLAEKVKQFKSESKKKKDDGFEDATPSTPEN